MGIAPDLAARKIIVAAYMYYVLDDSPMSDGEYDKLSQYVADNWDQVDPVRQWQMGSNADTRASGGHFKFTVLAVDAARLLYWERNKRCTNYPYPHKWKNDKKMKLRYVTTIAS